MYIYTHYPTASVLGKGPRLDSSTSLLSPVVSTESSFLQLIGDMMESRTVTWETVTILYDSSTTMIDQILFKEMAMLLQGKISIITFDISVKSLDELFELKNRLGKNFFVIGKQSMALNVFQMVRKIVLKLVEANN